MARSRSLIIALVSCYSLQGLPLGAERLNPNGVGRPPCCFSLTHGEFLQEAPRSASEHRSEASRHVHPAQPRDGDVNLSVRWIDKSGRELETSRASLSVSTPSTPQPSPEMTASRFLIEVSGVSRPSSIRVSLVSVDPKTERIRDRRNIPSMKITAQGRARTPWLVLVADRDDRSASVPNEVRLFVALGDRVEARVRVGGRRARVWAMPVGTEEGLGDMKILRLETRFIVLDHSENGRPLAGGDYAGVGALVRHQLHVARQVLAQCGVSISDQSLQRFEVLKPPESGLIAVGGRLGLLSKGGFVKLRVDGRQLGPWKIGSRYTPLQTARLLSHQLASAGFNVELSKNPKRESHAYASADIIVRRRDGAPLHIEPWTDAPLTTEPTQSLEIGGVDLADGIDAYDDLSAAIGTLEERTLVKFLGDGKPQTVDIFVINNFSSSDRQGESFISGNGSSLRNTILLNLTALARARQSYTLSHELGHILLNDLGHSDGQDDHDTTSLMHSRSSSAMGGPKRLTSGECKQIRKNINKYLK